MFINLQMLSDLCPHARARFCTLSTNIEWSCCGYASARSCINDSCRFDAVSRINCPVLHPFLNPTCHTKGSCESLCQCKHINATLNAARSMSSVSNSRQAGLLKVNSSLKGMCSVWCVCCSNCSNRSLHFFNSNLFIISLVPLSQILFY